MTPRRGSLVPVVLILVLVLAGGYLGYLSRAAADPEPLQLAAGLCIGGALAVLLLRIVRRR